MRLDAERSSTYRIFTEYRADRPELQLEKRAAPALKVLLDATRRSTALSVPIPCRGILISRSNVLCSRQGRTYDLRNMAWANELIGCHRRLLNPTPDCVREHTSARLA